MVNGISRPGRPIGLSLVELIIAIGLFAVLAAATGAVAAALWPFMRAAERERAYLYAAEGAVALAAVAGTAFNTLAAGEISVAAVSGDWAVTPGPSDPFDGFDRHIIISPVYRGPDGALIEAGAAGAAIDILAYRADITIEWAEGGRPRAVADQAVISAWNAKRWQQSDWSLGAGSSVWTGDGGFDQGDDTIVFGEELSLATAASNTFALAGALVSAAYDTERSANFVALHFEADIPDDCAVAIALQTAPDGETPFWPENWSGPDGEDAYRTGSGAVIPAGHNGDRWVRYRLSLTGDGSDTPVVRSITIRYQ